MEDLFKLHDGEAVEYELKGDYWEKNLGLYSQKTGKYWFTNERIIFRGGFAVALDITYSDIESLSLCNVGPFIQFLPTGIKVKMKDDKAYKLSVLKRKDVLNFIQSKL